MCCLLRAGKAGLDHSGSSGQPRVMPSAHRRHRQRAQAAPARDGEVVQLRPTRKGAQSRPLILSSYLPVKKTMRLFCMSDFLLLPVALMISRLPPTRRRCDAGALAQCYAALCAMRSRRCSRPRYYVSASLKWACGLHHPRTPKRLPLLFTCGHSASMHYSGDHCSRVLTK